MSSLFTCVEYTKLTHPGSIVKTTVLAAVKFKNRLSDTSKGGVSEKECPGVIRVNYAR